MMKIKIKSEKQENGLWGSPLYCSSIDWTPINDKRKLLIFSASLIAISENYKSSFIIFNSNEDGFFIKINNTTYKLEYDRLEVFDNILYEFDNQKERIIFLRKHKIKELNDK